MATGATRGQSGRFARHDQHGPDHGEWQQHEEHPVARDLPVHVAAFEGLPVHLLLGLVEAEGAQHPNRHDRGDLAGMVGRVLLADATEAIGDRRLVESCDVDVGDALEAPDALVLARCTYGRSSPRR